MMRVSPYCCVARTRVRYPEYSVIMDWLCPSSHQVLSSTLHQEIRLFRGSHWLKCHQSVPGTSSVQSPSPPPRCCCCCSRVTEARILTPSFTPLYLQISNRDINHAASMVTPDQTCKQCMMMFRTESSMFGEGECFHTG